MALKKTRSELMDVSDRFVKLSILWSKAQANLTADLISYALNGHCSSDYMKLGYDIGYASAILEGITKELCISNDDLCDRVAVGCAKMAGELSD